MNNVNAIIEVLTAVALVREQKNACFFEVVH